MKLDHLIAREYQVRSIANYQCQLSACGDVGAAFHQKRLVATPEMLCVQLYRWRQDRINGSLQDVKDYRAVDVAPMLELHDYLDGGVPGLATYHLYALIKHRGTLEEGHYVAYVKSPNRWHQIDGPFVTPCTAEEAMAHELGDVNSILWTPYL